MIGRPCSYLLGDDITLRRIGALEAAYVYVRDASIEVVQRKAEGRRQKMRSE